jgi:hypothetical protein
MSGAHRHAESFRSFGRVETGKKAQPNQVGGGRIDMRQFLERFGAARRDSGMSTRFCNPPRLAAFRRRA